MIVPVKRALISVTDKQGIAEFASGLNGLGVEILSTGGTGKALAEAGVPFKDVSEETGFPEIFGGRLKTLHPLIHGGILYRRGHEADEKERGENNIEPLDLIIVNLYDFEGRTSGGNVSDAEAIEAVDIGGPTMIRAAAKNFEFVGVLTSPDQYATVLEELQNDGGLSLETRRRLSAEAFDRTARYDRMIADWFSGTGKETTETETMPKHLQFSLERHMEMRYGENPHQSAAFYLLENERNTGLAACRQLHGKALSFNNMIDADIALTLPQEF